MLCFLPLLLAAWAWWRHQRAFDAFLDALHRDVLAPEGRRLSRRVDRRLAVAVVVTALAAVTTALLYKHVAGLG